MSKRVISSTLFLIISFPAWCQLTVSGTSEVKVTPDEVAIVIGVESENAMLQKAKEENDEAIRKVLAFCAEQNISKKDIQTDYVRIYPVKEYPQQRPGQQGEETTKYRVFQSLSIMLRDISKYDNLITGLLQRGINTIQDISFQVSDIEKYREQARTLALKSASEKAKKMASDMGVTLENVKSIDEHAPVSNPPVPYARMSADNFSQGTTLAPGQITISGNVTVSYEIK